MAGNFKYTLQKNKTKLWIIGSLLVTALIAVGAYFLFTSDNITDSPEPFEQQVTIAEHILSGSEAGLLKLISVETGEVIHEKQLEEGNYLYAVGADYETIYAYDGKEVTDYTVSRSKIVEGDAGFSIALDDVGSFKATENAVAFLLDGETELVFVYEDEGGISTKEITSNQVVNVYNINDKKLMYSTEDALHVVTDSDEETVEIGDSTNSIQVINYDWIVQNQFGSELGDNILALIDGETSLIEEVVKTDNQDTILLGFDEDARQFYTSHYVDGGDPYHALTSWTLENNELKKDGDLIVKVPVREDAILYNDSNSVTSNGYLYTHFDDRMQIFDIRSQQESKRVDTDTFFATPILK